MCYQIVYNIGYDLFRQHEYIHLLDYQWKRQLKDDQGKVGTFSPPSTHLWQARSTKLVNKMLLQNILPQHVADVYLAKYVCVYLSM